MFTPNASQVVTFATDGSDPRYLGAIGHINGLTYSSVLPGGYDQMTCNLLQPPLQRWQALNPGRLVSIYRGASAVWNGIMNEPTASNAGWALQAYGSGHFGDDYMAQYQNYSVAGDPVVRAIGRGLRWSAPASWPAGLYLQQPPDSASVTITAYMNGITGPAAMLWYVGRGNQLSVFALPTAPTRILLATEPLARTLAGYFTQIWVRYMSQAASTTPSGSGNPGSGAAQYSLTSITNEAQADRHGTLETYADLSTDGQLTQAAAQDVATDLLAKYQAANFSGQFTVLPGQLLTLGGQPVDLGCEQAGSVIQVMVTAGGYGGDVIPAPPIQFVAGAYQYNDETETATVTPYLGVANNLATLLSNYVTVHTKP